MTAPEGQLLTTEEVAERLQVDEQTVRRWIKSGKLEAFKPGREWRISPAAFETLLESYSSPKARSSSPEAPEESEGERLLTKLIRRLIADAHADAERWESAALDGEVSLDVYRELVGRRISLQGSLSTLDDVSKTLDVNISDRRGSPLRRVRRELQSAFNRWNAARSTLIDLHFDAVMEQEEEDVEAAEEGARSVTDLALYREEKSAGERMASQAINDVG